MAGTDEGLVGQIEIEVVKVEVGTSKFKVPKKIDFFGTFMYEKQLFDDGIRYSREPETVEELNDRAFRTSHYAGVQNESFEYELEQGRVDEIVIRLNTEKKESTYISRDHDTDRKGKRYNFEIGIRGSSPDSYIDVQKKMDEALGSIWKKGHFHVD